MRIKEREKIIDTLTKILDHHLDKLSELDRLILYNLYTKGESVEKLKKSSMKKQHMKDTKQ